MSTKARLLSVVERLAPRRRLIYLVTLVFGAMLVAAFVFEHGDWTRTEVLHGPFAREATGTQYSVPIAENVPYLSIPSPELNSEGAADESSSIRLWVNGKPWNPPQAPQPSFSQSQRYGIPGLVRTLEFSLPPQVANDSSTTVTVTYHVFPRPAIYRIFLLFVVALTFLAFILAYCSDDCGWIRALAARARPADALDARSELGPDRRQHPLCRNNRIWRDAGRRAANGHGVPAASLRKIDHRPCILCAARHHRICRRGRRTFLADLARVDAQRKAPSARRFRKRGFGGFGACRCCSACCSSR